MDDFSFFDCSSSFYFLLNEFHCIFFIYHKILHDYVYYQLAMNDLSFFDYSCSFYFLLIEFHCNFSISFKIIRTILCLLIVYFDEVMIGRRDFLSRFTSYLPSPPYSRLSPYLHLYLYLISFLLVPCASVWENTLASVPPHFL